MRKGMLFLLLLSLSLSLGLQTRLGHAEDSIANSDTLSMLRSDLDQADFSKNCDFLTSFQERLQLFGKEELSRQSERAGEAIQELFQSRLKLREQLKRVASGELPRSCADAIRATFNEMRIIEDYITMLYGRTQASKGITIKNAVLRGEAPLLVSNPPIAGRTADGVIELKSGDILLSRGARFISAMIAKITRPAGLFSHAALVYVDDKTGQAYTVEAHIEVGTLAAPISKYLDSHGARVMVFRYSDSKLAHEAAKQMYLKAAHASKKHRNIKYDFSMDMSDHAGLFCSEVPAYAYEMASQGQVLIPAFRSRMDRKMPDFMGHLGIQVQETFAPIDMELDPRFEVIAEWRNLDKLQGTWYSDAIMSRIYDWMERHEYVLKGTPGISILKWVAWTVRKIPIFQEALREKLPTNMSRDVLEVVGILNKIENRIYPILEKSNEEHFAQTGTLLVPQEMEAMLDSLRVEDYEQYKKYLDWRHDYTEEGLQQLAPKVLFHKYLSPVEAK